MIDEISNSKIRIFQKKLLSWYILNGRTFAWRKSGLSNYKLIIAEILLQRTKAETVEQYYTHFIRKYKNWKMLNNARPSILEKAIKPLGLYRQKTKLIKKLAREMVLRNGRIPPEKEEIEKLPFAGQYITNAIILLIKNRPAPLLDTNMARVLERFFKPRNLVDIRYDPYLQKLAWEVTNHRNSKRLNWAILDFAALICKPKNPKCPDCLLSQKCHYYSNL